ncbi:Fatty acid desaturase [Sulfitobacter noctilucicola]|uniref:Alkane 1-monooxygenase n=1 Tax=Sulfitobacter noctilucicola TaxID=1342301 RepID=A0A7W6Q3K6_9RHOB|nr:alkane 1-monooxygenase [Sulfitobacter noctilucicola]KIN64523.1 Fatty acid desaturase [Sulfitobacter noctilucicola]MBB4174320.1 alkane 1-monooxygenase [Sulfitobacter noctilucicola]
MFWYAVASLTPAVLLGLAALTGGPFAVLALLSITVVVFLLDKLSGSLPNTEESGRRLSLILAAVHFPLLGLGVWALGGMSLNTLEKLLLFTGLGLYFGQVSNSNAHELIHATSRWPRRIGSAIYVSLLHGHHVSAHLRVHHVHAATDADPNSARTGEGFWAYVVRVFQGEFMQGLEAENAHRVRARTKPAIWNHPYVGYVVGAAVMLLLAFMIAGGKGLIAYLAIALYAQLQLLLSDYVQHYGLRREVQPDGRTEPMGPHHSWNAPKWYSSAMMLNAPKHSDHHMRPSRAFPALEVTPDTMPVLPHSLPVMAVIALFPPLWRRLMDRRVAKWRKST